MTTRTLFAGLFAATVAAACGKSPSNSAGSSAPPAAADAGAPATDPGPGGTSGGGGSPSDGAPSTGGGSGDGGAGGGTASGTPDAGAPPARFSLRVQVNGSGKVSSTPSGIDCDAPCAAIFDAGTRVDLVAAPAPGFEFSGFAGACSGTSCSVAMSADVDVVATFAASAGNLQTVDCPEPPRLLWSHTFSGDVDFHGSVDDAGDLYWLEFARTRSEQDPNPPALVVSADADGRERFRVSAPFANGLAVVAGKLISSRGSVLAAYDSATGRVSWSVDFAALQSATSVVGSFVGATKDTIAVAVNDASSAAIYFMDASTGEFFAYNLSTTDHGRSIVATDGAGSVLISANASGTYPYEGDLFLLDASAAERWREHLVDTPSRVIAWPAGLPWVASSTSDRISSNGHYWASGGIFAAAFTDRFGIGFDASTFVRRADGGSDFPLGVDLVRDHRVVARVLLPDLDTFDGVSALPLASGDHVDFVAQSFHHLAGLCHPSGPGPILYGRADERRVFRCGLAPAFNWINTAVLSAGHLVLGTTAMTTTACNAHEFDPVTIEAYSLPGRAP